MSRLLLTDDDVVNGICDVDLTLAARLRPFKDAAARLFGDRFDSEFITAFAFEDDVKLEDVGSVCGADCAGLLFMGEL